MATASTTLSTFDLPDARLRSRSLSRLGAGLLTGAATSLSLIVAPPDRRPRDPRERRGSRSRS